MFRQLIFTVYFFFFFKQKTAYEITHSDWSSDVCSSDLPAARRSPAPLGRGRHVCRRRPSARCGRCPGRSWPRSLPGLRLLAAKPGDRPGKSLAEGRGGAHAEDATHAPHIRHPTWHVLVALAVDGLLGHEAERRRSP